MLLTTEDMARTCHEANRALQIATGDPAVSPTWDEAPQHQRDSAVDGVHKARDGATAAELHDSWCEFKRADGWTHGPIKDADAKTHPALVPYAELPDAQLVKDAVFRAVITATEPYAVARVID